jgi:hypothetical protein
MALIVQTLGVLGTLIAATIAVRSYVYSNKRAQETRDRELETRRNQFLMQVNESMTNVGFWRDVIDLMNMEWTDIDDFERKWGTGGNPEAAAKRLSVWWRFNYVGDLLRRGLIDRDWIFDVCGSFAIQQWGKWQHIIELNRQLFNVPSLENGLEYLAEEMVKVGQERGSVVKVMKTLKDEAHLGQVEKV